MRSKRREHLNAGETRISKHGGVCGSVVVASPYYADYQKAICSARSLIFVYFRFKRRKRGDVIFAEITSRFFTFAA